MSYLFFHTDMFVFQILDKAHISHDGKYHHNCGCHIQEAFRKPWKRLTTISTTIEKN